MKPLVVGISGVTNGGKTTLSMRLQQHLLSPEHLQLFKQDEYFFPEDSPRHVPSPGGLAHHNWDVISALDMDALVADVRKAVQEAEKKVILVDGFVLFDDPRMVSLCDLKFFLTLSKDLCKQRRATRFYDPPDPAGYFEKCVWPMYIEHLQRIKPISGIQFIDGNDCAQKTFDFVKHDIESKISDK